MQSSWVKRLFEDDFQDWKVIPLFLRGKHLGKNFKFHNRYKQWHLAQILRLTVDLRIFFSDKNVNVIGQLFNDNKNIKLWKNTEFEFHLKDTHKIYWLQIIDALPKTWKDVILKDKGNAKYLVIFDHHVVRNSQMRSLEKELYLILVEVKAVKPTAQDYFE